jgi:CBS domain-containing protein
MTITVDDYMATEVVSFTPEDNIINAMRILLNRHLSGAPVLDRQGELVGMLSQKDCFAVAHNAAYHDDWGGLVRKYMKREVECIEAGTGIVEAIDRFRHSNYRRFPVLREGKLVGQISRHDLLRALDEIYFSVGF